MENDKYTRVVNANKPINEFMPDGYEYVEIVIDCDNNDITDDMVIIESGEKKSRIKTFVEKETYENFCKLKDFLKEKYNIDISINSAGRTFLQQAKIKKNHPDVAANPMQSEHHLGTALDLHLYQEYPFYIRALIATRIPIVKKIVTKLHKAYLHTLLAKHEVDFGFITRYKAGKYKYTGVPNEAWHKTYVGDNETARFITKFDLTLEEYDKVKQMYNEFITHNNLDITKHSISEFYLNLLRQNHYKKPELIPVDELFNQK